jgi:hypothetical protein
VLFYNPAVGNAMWNAPPDLPSKAEAAEYPMTVLFLDEMNSAAPATQAAAYQLVLNRKIGTYELPDNCVIVAAGNRDTDRGVTYRMPKPLANRFVHLQLRVDFESWQNWAIDNHIHPDVLAYITCNKGDLFQFDPASHSVSFATPRSWVFVSQLLSENPNETELNDLVAGTVGEGIGLKFGAHRRVAAQMPNPSHILQGKINELKNKDLGAKYSLTISLCYELKASYDNRGGGKDKNGNERMKETEMNLWHKEIDNVLRFILDHMDTELQVMFVSMIMKNYQLPMRTSKLSNYSEFHNRNGNYIIEALRPSS